MDYAAERYTRYFLVVRWWLRAAVLGRMDGLSPSKSGCSILPTARLYGGRSLPRFASGLSCRLNFRGRAHPTTRQYKEM